MDDVSNSSPALVKKVQGTHTAEYGALSSTKARHLCPMLEMERLVLIWIEDYNHRGLAISLDEVQFKAKSLYDLVKSKMTFCHDKGP